MSVNKNLSKLALNLNANGDVLDAGLAVTYSSNNYVRSRFDNGDGGRLVSNNFISDSFPSNTYITGTFTTNNYVDGRFSSNSFVTDTFSSNTFSRNASNLSEGTVPSGRLSGTYGISISGSADRVDGKDATDFISNTYAIATYTSNNYVDGRFASNNHVRATYTSNNYLQDTVAIDSFRNAVFSANVTTSATITGGTTATLIIKDSSGSTIKTIRGV